MGAQIVEGDITPDVEELQGRQDTEIAIPVELPGPARVQVMPAVSGAAGNKTVTSTVPVAVTKRDITRARIVITSKDTDIYVGFSQDVVLSGTGFILPKGQLLTLNNVGRVWVMSTGADTAVSTIVESWTE